MRKAASFRLPAARPLRITTSRGFRIGFVVLLVVSAAQIAYWVWDEVRFTASVRERQRLVLAAEARAAEMLRESLAPERVAALFPRLHVPASGPPEVREAVRAELDEEVRSRVNRFVWEGGFFLVVLCAGMVILTRSLRQEARLRRREENFLASVSHELKSPLASIRLSAETLAARDPTPERRAKLAGRLLEDVQRLETMVSNIVDTCRVDEEGAARARERTSVADAVRDALSALSPLLDDRGVTVRTRLDEDAAVVADPEAVRTVARNLLDNARKATARTAGAVIEVTASRGDGRVRLRVEDNGAGFDPREAPRLFEKFYRPGDELRRAGAGSGLGLYLVRRHVERDGGRVEASSGGAGQGAEFEVEWPAAGARERS